MEEIKYDVIIIGAGLGGLSAGCCLVNNNKKILLIDKNAKVGGYATNFRRNGFVFDVSLHNILYKNDGLRSILTEIGVNDEIEYIPFNEFCRAIFPNHDIVIPNNIDEYISILNEEFSSEGRGIERLFKLMLDVYDELLEIERFGISIDKIKEELPFLPMKFPNLVKLQKKTCAEIMGEFIKDEELKSIISSPWWIYGMPPSKLASILFSVPTIQFHNTGGGILKGTSQKLSDTMLKRIEMKGGSFLKNTSVNRIITSKGGVKGVVTDNDETFWTPIVIANANPRDVILNMLTVDEVDDVYRKRVEDSELSISATQLFLGLDVNPESLSMNSPSVAMFDSYDHEECYQNVLEGNYEKSFCFLTNYTAFDETVAPEGKGVLNILTLDHIKNWENLSNDEYKIKKTEVSKMLIEKAETQVHGLSEHIEVLELGTPVTMQRYTRNANAAIYGFAQTNEQSGVNRFTTDTPIGGLYFANAYTYPGAGYSSVISAGYRAAKTIMEKQK
ncbi:MAG: NAD(P)/FAD-dependent oxidoreductase [Proteobacteria bacterium]|nr:NAD(P)/FAD-dependent oxidoreductase [Pseudomonadota bacterium]